MGALAFIDSDAHPKAVQYFGSFPEEPVGRGEWLAVDSIMRVPSMTLVRLLEAMRNAYGTDKGADALVVTHGGDKGLTMLLDARAKDQRYAPASAYTDALEVLLDPNMTLEKKAEVLFLNQSRLRSLTQHITAVQQLKLGRMEFRACNIGKEVKNLHWLVKLFGAKSAGAPDIYDAYNSINPRVTSDKRAWTKWQKDHAGARIYQTSGGKLALYTRRVSATRFTADAIAESRAAVQQWIADHLPTPGANSSTGEFPIHVLWPDLIFPRDSQYTDHIIRYTA